MSHAPLRNPSSGPFVTLVVAVLLFLLGFYAHLELGNTKVDAIYKTLQLFHLHFHPFPEGAGADVERASQHVPWIMEIARFGTGAWALALIPATFFLLFRDYVLRRWTALFWRNHVVVCGDCPRTVSLVRDLRRAGRHVVLVHRRADTDLLPGVLCLEGDPADPELLRWAVPQRAARVISLFEDDRTNLEVLVAVQRFCTQRNASMPPLEVHAHISDLHLQSGLYRTIAAAVVSGHGSVRENFFNYYELMARLLVRCFSLPAFDIGPDQPPRHLVIVGFDSFGQNVALRIAKTLLDLYPTGVDSRSPWAVRRPRITIVDPCGEDQKSRFLRDHPAFKTLCELEVCPISTSDNKFSELSFLPSDNSKEHTSVVFCLEDEAASLPAVLDLLGSKERIGEIYLRIAQPERLGGLLERCCAPSAPRLRLFAPDYQLFTAGMLLNQRLDVLARAVHQAYLAVEAADRRDNNLPPAAGKSWEELKEDDRRSNREAADHLWAKLHILGYDLEELDTPDSEPRIDLDILRVLKEHEEDLARLEHQRWMAWRVLNGWRYGPVRNDIDKLHPDIVAYEALAENTKAKDRANVRVSEALWQEGRIRIKPAAKQKSESALL